MVTSMEKSWQEPQSRQGSVDALSHDVPQTDPVEVQELWAAVRAYNNNMADNSEPAAIPPRKRARTDDDKEAIESEPPTKKADLSSRKSTVVTMDSLDFEQLVLIPRGIRIHNDRDRNQRPQDPYKHFKTENNKPKDYRHIKFYNAIKSLEKSTIWLDPSPEFQELIVEGYNAMAKWEEVEEEFAVFAQKHLLKSEPPRRNLPKERFWLAEAKTEISFKPEGPYWVAPPVVDEEDNPAKFSWNLKPDVTYWLTLQAFNAEYRNQIQHYFYVKNTRILAPYLTVEFKRNKTSSRKGMNQVAAAGSLALYNRFLLRKDAIGNNSWNAADLLENVRHYGLTMEGLDFKFWVLEPRIENGQWTGVDMRWLDVEAFREDDKGFGFNTFIKWLNEIHRWGLAVHGPSVEKDIKKYIENDQNSNIFPSQQRGPLIEELED